MSTIFIAFSSDFHLPQRQLIGGCQALTTCKVALPFVVAGSAHRFSIMAIT